MKRTATAPLAEPDAQPRDLARARSRRGCSAASCEACDAPAPPPRDFPGHRARLHRGSRELPRPVPLATGPGYSRPGRGADMGRRLRPGEADPNWRPIARSWYNSPGLPGLERLVRGFGLEPPPCWPAARSSSTYYTPLTLAPIRTALGAARGNDRRPEAGGPRAAGP